jgi:hypothetical protein
VQRVNSRIGPGQIAAQTGTDALVTKEVLTRGEWQMIQKTKYAMLTIALCMGMFIVTSAVAQSPTNATAQDKTTQHHLRQYQMMKDMTQEMSAMTEQMSRGDLTPDQRKQVAQRMAFMSTMMRRMSGLEARPAMREAEWQNQMDQMRKQMDDMMRNSSIKPAGR